MTTLSKARQKHYAVIYLTEQHAKSVTTFYKNCSYAKQQAEKEILERMKKYNGYDYQVIGGNCSAFTAIWVYKRGCDNKTILVVETYAHTYEIDLYNV